MGGTGKTLFIAFVCCFGLVIAELDSACYEISDTVEIIGNECTLLNTCKFSDTVENLSFVYDYSLVNSTGYPDETYTVRYYLDELVTGCLNISDCCVGGICNDTSNPLHGSAMIGTAYSGPSYSLYACNLRGHSAYLQGESHFEYYPFNTDPTADNSTNIWVWMAIVLAGIFCIAIVAAVVFGFVVYRKKRQAASVHSYDDFLE